MKLKLPNDIEIEYNDDYLNKVKLYFNKSDVSDDEIYLFFLKSLNNGINKNYVLYENK